MIKEWRPVIGYEGSYIVSDKGNIASVFRVIMRSNGRPHTIRPREMKTKLDNNGYERTALSGIGKLKTVKVHRIVAEAFIGTLKEKEVNHIDGVKTNNCVNNLEIVTRSQNVQHAFDTGLAVGLKGSNNASAKIDEIKAITVKTLLKTKISCSKIAKNMNISIHIVKDISRGKTWKHV